MLWRSLDFSREREAAVLMGILIKLNVDQGQQGNTGKKIQAAKSLRMKKTDPSLLFYIF